jgi:hypothetical protein
MNSSPTLRAPASRFAGPLVVLLAALLATAALLIRATSCGHDFDFHLISWIDCLHSWRQGILYPHWAPSPNYGAGEPRFVFYPPLVWMLGAALGAILPWRAVPFAMTILLLAGIGLATRALARQAMADGPATLAGCAAIFSGYALFTAYERTAFAELAGGFWIPLMLLLVLRERPAGPAATGKITFWRLALDGSSLWLALVVAGAWLSNAPVGVMASYLLAAFALAVAVLSKSWVPVLRATLGAALGLGLSAFYLVPAAWQQRWVSIRQATEDPGDLIENNWLFARHSDAQFHAHDVELAKVSLIAVSMIALALAGVLVCRLRRSLPGPRRWWIPLALIPVAILLLQFPLSMPVWNALPKLRYLQFPWRWLVALEGPMGIFFAAAVWQSTRWRRVAVVAVCAAVFMGASVFAGLAFFQACDVDDSVAGMLETYGAGAGFQGNDEYAPAGADNSLAATALPAACLVRDPATVMGQGDPDIAPLWTAEQRSCDATYSFAPVAKAASEHWRIHANIEHAGYLVLRLRSYPAWNVRVNGRPAAMPTRDDGLIAVPVPEGPVDVTADWTTTRDVVLGRCISLIALVFITALGVLLRRLTLPQLS